MALTELQDVNATRISDIFVYVGEIVPFFWTLVLAGMWVILCLGTYFSQKRLTGTGDFLASAAVASYATVVAATVLALIPGLISVLTLSIFITITVVTTVLLMTSRDRG
jgi:hypothetical protein